MKFTDRHIRMLTKKGFVELFWDEYKRLQRNNPTVTHEEVYNLLETEYQSATGQRRYANFKSFRARRDD